MTTDVGFRIQGSGFRDTAEHLQALVLAVSTCKCKHGCARIQPPDMYLQHGDTASHSAVCV